MEQARLLILFGSQTGNSQDAAERISRQAKQRGYRPVVQAMDAYSVQSLPQENCVVFVASTTGQGEAPSNMKTFWRFLLRKSLPPDSLASTQYAIFGLGDSGYVNYNVVAKKLDRRLAALGAHQLVPRGLGDDQHPLGYDAALDPWLKDFWAHLRLLHPLPAGVQEPSPEAAAALDTPKFSVTFLPPPDSNGHAAPALGDSQADAAAAAHAFGCLEAAASGITQEHETLAEPLSTLPSGWGPGRPCMATLATNQRITAADHFQDTRHLEFDLGPNGPTYEPGDILSVFPHQSEATVQQLQKILDLPSQQLIQIQIELEDAPGGVRSVQTSMQVELCTFLQGVLDINGASPRRYFFEVLQHFAEDELQRERLQHFASAEGREDLALYNQSEGRTVLEVLQDFSSARLPLNWLIQTCPRLQPRQFSIASSAAAHPRQAHITLAIVDYRTPFKRRKRGLCSSWLAALRPGAKVPVWAERGVLHLPSLDRPLIMIGPGTGLAPFRAFLEERELEKDAGKAVAPAFLYFGCRNAEKDFYYKEQLQGLQGKGILAEQDGLVTAFSRDQTQKVYVTHKLAERTSQLYQLLQQGAYIYICGSAKKMPQEVAAILREGVLQAKGGLTAAEAEKYLRQLELAGRYTVEAWS